MVEPAYRGANGRIDAMAAAWLLSQDYVFFDEGDIAWNGKRQVISGIQLNADKVGEIPKLMKDPQMYLRGVVDLMTALGEDEGLRVTCSKMHRSLRGVLGENGLTGALLFGLQAYGRVFSLISTTTASCNPRVRRKALDVAKGRVEGIDPGSVIAVAVDPRLPKCVPGFYELIKRMVADMHAYNGEDDKAFVLVFVDQECPKANQLFYGMRAPFSGAVYEPLHVEYQNIEPTRICESSPARVGSSQGVRPTGGKKPVGGKTAKGRRFTVTLPEDWTVYKNCHDEVGGFTRPFVAVRGGRAGKYDYDDCDQKDKVFYAVTSNNDRFLTFGNKDLCWLIAFCQSYDTDNILCQSTWDMEVQAVNTMCFISQKMQIIGDTIQFLIYPYALDHHDFIRCDFVYKNSDDLERLRGLACKIASAVELDKPLISSCEETLAKAIKEKVLADEFFRMVDNFTGCYSGLRQNLFNAASRRHVNQFDGASESDSVVAGAQGVAGYAWRVIPVFAKLMDAYAVQVANGASLEERKTLLTVLDNFDARVFTTVDMFSDDNPERCRHLRSLMVRAKVFEPPVELVKVRKRLERAKEQVGLGK